MMKCQMMSLSTEIWGLDIPQVLHFSDVTLRDGKCPRGLLTIIEETLQTSTIPTRLLSYALAPFWESAMKTQSTTCIWKSQANINFGLSTTVRYPNRR